MNTQENTIQVILVDDHETIHIEVGDLLSALDGIDLIAHGYNGSEAVQLCNKHKPDLVLMDFSMPVMNGIEATRAIVSKYPHIKVIALSGVEDSKVVQEMIGAGASGYILKNAHPEDLASTLRAVHGGQSVFSTDIVKPLLGQSSPPTKSPRDYGLTRREMDVLRELGQGLTNKEVANELHISTATVRFHITNIIEKLGAENRTQALMIAAHNQLI